MPQGVKPELILRGYGTGEEPEQRGDPAELELCFSKMAQDSTSD